MIFGNLSICNPDQVLFHQTLEMKNNLITRVENFDKKNTDYYIDLKGCTVYPGFINTHDHLLGSYLPRVGNGPYLNWRPWDQDLKSAGAYHERNQIDVGDIYQLAFYRQILSGVTTVCDHIPHEVNDPYVKDKDTWIRVIKNYCLAHEMSSYELPWGDGHEVEIKRAKEENKIFITHIEEGFDKEAKEGIDILKAKGGLFENTLLVHCISCSDEDIDDIARAKASVVWCPVSNMFMFNKTADIKQFLEKGVNVCLGTDSPMSGGLNLLDELRKARKIYKKKYGKYLSSKLLFQLITKNPAKAFNLYDKIGSIESNKEADFVVIRDRKTSFNKYSQLFKTSFDDIEMVVRAGKILYCKEQYYYLLPSSEKYSKIKNTYQPAYLIGSPLNLKYRIKEKVNFEKHLEFFPITAFS